MDIQLKTLSDEQRLQAKEQALALVQRAIGSAPKRDDYSHEQASLYPRGFTRLITLATSIALLSAFFISAVRMYSVARDTVLLTIEHELTASIVGLCFVILAELTMLILSVYVAIVQDVMSKRILYLAMSAVTLLALVANATSARLDEHRGAWMILEALLPPFLVLSLGYVLKSQLLAELSTRTLQERLFQDALKQWQAITREPERHSSFLNFYANALRAMLLEVNAKGLGATQRKEYLLSLTNEQWRALVIAEIKSEQWLSSEHLHAVPSPRVVIAEPIQHEQASIKPVSEVVQEPSFLAMTNGKHNQASD